MSFSFTRAADLHAAYRAGTTDPIAVAARALTAARGLDALLPPMRTFIALDEADVVEQARASAQRWESGQTRGPLDGVPIAVKDEFDVRGYATTAGTRFLGRTKATADALVVARLRAAGAIVFGKTNMHELGVHPSGLNLWHGTARNPYDPARDTGGSSSGSGAVVALGVTPIALGNDGGGSIRIPAALNGVCGHKPTFGRVPTDGVRLLCWSLESSGPLATTVDDLVTAMTVLTDAPLLLPPLKSLRIGVCTPWWSWATGEVQAIARAAVEKIVGGEIVEVALPHIELS
ncbi:MAG TPA: amidase, partial [Polyangia bacterium]|nr:amidase [Polyangia bacterium]